MLYDTRSLNADPCGVVLIRSDVGKDAPLIGGWTEFFLGELRALCAQATAPTVAARTDTSEVAELGLAGHP